MMMMVMMCYIQCASYATGINKYVFLINKFARGGGWTPRGFSSRQSSVVVVGVFSVSLFLGRGCNI